MKLSIPFPFVILLAVPLQLLAMVVPFAHADILVGNYFSGDVFQYSNDGAFIRNFAVNDPRIYGIGGLAQQPDGTILVASMSAGVPGSDDILMYDPVTSAYLGRFTQVSSFAQESNRTILSDIVVGPTGDVFAGLLRNQTIRRYDGVTGQLIETFNKGVLIDIPLGQAFGPDGNLYVAALNSDAVLRFNGTTGEYMGSFAASGGLDNPSKLVFGPDGNLYVSSRNTDDVKRYDGTTGAFLGTFAQGGGLNSPEDLKFGPDGNLYVVSFLTNQIKKYDGLTGAYLGNAISDERLSFPLAIEFIGLQSVPEPEPIQFLLVLFGVAGLIRYRRAPDATVFP